VVRRPDEQDGNLVLTLTPEELDATALLRALVATAASLPIGT
jgi:hypothetical protein